MTVGVNGRSDGDYYLRTACQESSAPARDRSPAEYYERAVEHGEPAGVWMTRGSNSLDLHGEVDPDQFRTLVNDLRDPRTGEALGKRPYHFATPSERVEALRAKHPDAAPEELAAMRINASRQSRQANHTFDITFSAPKSWSVLHAALEKAGRQQEADAVWAALMAGVNAAMDFAARDLAYTRDQSGAPTVAGRATSRYVANGNWTAAAFRHHTSRDQDPQLHVHVALLNRVKDEVTGRWKTLYSPALTKSKHTLDAVFLRVAEAELTRTTGHTVVARPDGAAREIRGVAPEVRDFFSTRTRAITEGAKQLIAEFKAKYDREPSAALRYKINQHVTLDTRAPKAAEPPARDELLARWEAELGEKVAGGLAQVLAQTDAQRADRAVTVDGLGFEPAQVLEQAIADLDSTRSTFTRNNVYAAINNRLPERLEHLTNEQIVAVLDDLVDAAVQHREVVSLIPPSLLDIPDELRDERGRYVFDDPMADRYATRTGLAREDSLVARLGQAGGRAVPEPAARAALEGCELGTDQHAAVLGVLTSAQRMHLVVGPAGAGKSRMMDALDRANETLNGAGVIGLTASENAAQVLRGEGVSKAFNIARFLNYHQRAAEGRVSEAERREFAIPAGAVIVLDEAGTIPTRDFYDVMAILDRESPGKVLAVGDPEQADAVENAGVFALLVDHGEPHHLETVRRFHNQWEADASVRLRAGDAQAVHQYDIRDRVHGGTPEEMRRAAVDGFLLDHRDGRDTLVITSSQDEADRVSSMIRERLVETGEVAAEGVGLRHGSLLAGVGDRVQTRHNDRGLGVFNRDLWTVSAVLEDGALAVRRGEVERTLPSEYVVQWLDLAYAGPVLSVQGRSVDSGHLLVDDTMGRSSVYPGSSRGRETNHFYVHIGDGQTAVGRLVDAVELDDHSPAARTVITAEQDRAENLGNLGAQWSMLRREDRAADHRVVVREELGADADQVLADRAAAGLFRLMHAAEAEGRDPREALRAARAQGSLATARSAAQVLHHRMERHLDAMPRREPADSYLARTPDGDRPRDVLTRQVAGLLDGRRELLGDRAAQEPPGWAAQLGPVPEDPVGRAQWAERAGWIEAFREQHGIIDEKRPIGTQPPRFDTDRRWLWDKAADALGVDPVQRDLEAQTGGALLNRVQQWQREQEWMPPNVDDRLQQAHRAQDEARKQAVEQDSDPARDRAERARTRVETLEAVAAARSKSWEATTEVREQARLADHELGRRDPGRVQEPEVAVTPEPVSDEGLDQSDLARAHAAMTELSRRADLNRERDAAVQNLSPAPTLEPAREKQRSDGLEID